MLADSDRYIKDSYNGIGEGDSILGGGISNFVIL
jgi:hypothetical protein